MKKLRFLLASLVFLLIVLACGQVKATTLSNPVDLGAFLNSGGGNVSIDGSKITLNHDVSLTESLYIYSADKTPMTIDLNGYKLDFTFSSDQIAAIWANSAGELTITDSSNKGTSFIRTNRDSIISYNTATLKVENTKLVGMYSCTDPIISNCGKNTTYLKNVEISSYKSAILGQENVDYYLDNVTFKLGDSGCEYGMKLVGHNNVELKNCNYKSSVGAGKLVWITSDSVKATIDGGTYEYSGSSSNYLLLNENGTLEIKDGTFTHKEGTVLRTVDGTTTISGGAFDGKNKTITTTSGTTLTLKGGYFNARSNTSEPGAAIGFSMSKALDDIIADGYFATNTETRTNSGFRLTAPEICVYAKPASVTFDKTEFIYNGENQTPSVIVKDTEGKTLQYGTDYVVQYPAERKDAGEYKAKVVFIDRYDSIPEQELSYKINKADFDMSNFKFENKTVSYNGKVQSITATGVPAGLNVTYLNNNNSAVGTYSITAHFEVDTKNYNPILDKESTLTITQRNISEVAVSGIKNKTYTGKKVTQSVELKNEDIVLKEETDYDLKYSSNKKIGTAKITITGKGNYTGTITKTFKITPKGTSIKKLSAGKKQFKLTWKKQKTQTTGYEVQYSTNKKFKSGNKKVTIKKNKTTSSTVKKLKAKKKYYVRIRTYKTVNGKKIYSDWSKVKNVKTKK